MKTTLLAAAFAALVSFPLVLGAAETTKTKGGAFGAADTDGDGRVTEAEYVTGMNGQLDAATARVRFAELDKNKDGKLTRTEFNAGAPKKATKEPKEKKTTPKKNQN